MNNKISIQRALTTIKLFEKNFTLHNAFQSATLVSNGKTANGETLDVFNNTFNNEFKSIKDKIDHIFKLRKAIQRSNMENVVEVPHLGTMSIADVIIYRQTTLPHVIAVAEKLTSQYNDVVRKYEQSHSVWVKDLNEAIGKINSNKNDDSSAGSSDYHKALINEIEKREPKIVFDKENHTKYVELVEFFKEELDIILSEHNASTFISLD